MTITISMISTIHGTALLLMICTASMLAGTPVQNASVETGKLNSRIGPANTRRYESVREAKDWANPYLVIDGDGVEVISTGLPSGRRTVASTDLRRLLIDLPVTAWPYGRVVVVQDSGVRASDQSDKPITDNRNATLAILKTLHVTVESWPSA